MFDRKMEISDIEREVITTVFGEVCDAMRNHESIYIDDLIRETEHNLGSYVDDFTDEAAGRTTEEILEEVFKRFGVGIKRNIRTSERGTT